MLTDLDSFRTILARDPFENWENNSMSEGAAEDGLLYGLELLYAHDTTGLTQQYLQRCLTVADRIVREDKLRRHGGLPESHGRLLRCVAYARALLGARLDQQSLVQASQDYEASCTQHEPDVWDSLVQAYYLNAVRLALIGNNPERSRRLMAVRRAFPWHRQQHKLLKALCEARNASPLLQDDELFAAFDALFDLVRDPDFRPEEFCEVHILRFELAAIRDKYFISTDCTIDWKRVIDAVSA